MGRWIFHFVFYFACLWAIPGACQDQTALGRWLPYADWSKAVHGSGTQFLLVSADWCGPCKILKQQIERELFPKSICVVLVDFDKDDDAKLMVGDGTLPRFIRYTVSVDGGVSGVYWTGKTSLKHFTGLEN